QSCADVLTRSNAAIKKKSWRRNHRALEPPRPAFHAHSIDLGDQLSARGERNNRTRRPRQAGLRLRSRQTARSGGGFAWASNAAMTGPVPSKYPLAPVSPWRTRENGRSRGRRRGLAKNSNVPTAPIAPGSGFVTSCEAATREIFSPVFGLTG